ncbi:hypothetical protein GCM10027592_26000 [Spirosoma flavus]
MQQVRYHSPNQADDLLEGYVNHENSAEEHTIDAPQGTAAMSDNDQEVTTDNLSFTDDDTERLGEEDNTILGAGGSAGGLSGDGERTDEYDAAVWGIGD